MAQQERAVRTRRALLEAAGAAFDEHGYASTTLTMVFTRAGLTKGAFYHHFKSKEELAQALLDEQVNLGAVAPQVCKIQEIVDITFMFSHRLVEDALVRGSARLSTDQGAPPGVDHSSPYRQWPEALIPLLETAREQGELLPTVEPREAAELIVGGYAGIQIMSRALTDRADLGYRLSTLWSYILGSMVTPGMIAKIDITPDRGDRVVEAARAYNSSPGTAETDPPV
ncbi:MULTISPECIES: ScbR family autoregulator-binding transcription factor [unclassified Streptomyces]|uniref:ScbR family autoregulator-binding transcription factor n=1 Tax=unclassified Streptomyces TaxID=2593676 RepID=UPI00081D6754|nr:MULTISPECIES: ScbR family autoregulator-binding transcription factor [unclassified Streptomyces]MYZ36001.1 TetR family transcriptional regulator [Streptomyces sp. SID4917]SCF80141.1 transcriptional regulator, TetR family [Streptomyces sp. MnatMP-M17]